MRVIAQIPHPECQVTLFAWNGKYIVKIERGMLEQTYKISEMDVSGEADAHLIIGDENFMRGVMHRFSEMDTALAQAMDTLEM